MFSYAPKTRSPSTVELHAQTHSPVIAIDRRWCFPKPVTLRVEENPLSRKIKVRDLETNKPLVEIHRVDSNVSDLFLVYDAATHEQVATIDGFGFRGRFDVFRGAHKPSSKRMTGPLLVDATCAHVTVYFDDAEARRPTRAIVDGRWSDRVAVVSIHHAVSSQAVARINRPHHRWHKLPFYTIEVAPEVDILLPLVLWLGRWVQFEREQVEAVYRKTGDWGAVWM